MDLAHDNSSLERPTPSFSLFLVLAFRLRTRQELRCSRNTQRPTDVRIVVSILTAIYGTEQEGDGRTASGSPTPSKRRGGDELASDIGAQYVVTYAPKRPIESSADTAPRRVQVVSRRVSLQVRALRNKVAVGVDTKPEAAIP